MSSTLLQNTARRCHSGGCIAATYYYFSQLFPIEYIGHKNLSSFRDLFLPYHSLKIGTFIKMSRNNFVLINTPAPIAGELFKAIQEFIENRFAWGNETEKIQSRIHDDFGMRKIILKTLGVYLSVFG